MLQLLMLILSLLCKQYGHISTFFTDIFNNYPTSLLHSCVFKNKYGRFLRQLALILSCLYKACVPETPKLLPTNFSYSIIVTRCPGAFRVRFSLRGRISCRLFRLRVTDGLILKQAKILTGASALNIKVFCFNLSPTLFTVWL